MKIIVTTDDLAIQNLVKQKGAAPKETRQNYETISARRAGPTDRTASTAKALRAEKRGAAIRDVAHEAKRGMKATEVTEEVSREGIAA